MFKFTATVHRYQKHEVKCKVGLQMYFFKCRFGILAKFPLWPLILMHGEEESLSG